MSALVHYEQTVRERVSGPELPAGGIAKLQEHLKQLAGGSLRTVTHSDPDRSITFDLLPG